MEMDTPSLPKCHFQGGLVDFGSLCIPRFRGFIPGASWWLLQADTLLPASMVVFSLQCIDCCISNLGLLEALETTGLSKETARQLKSKPHFCEERLIIP